MTPEQWRTIGDVFDRAVLLPPGDRTAAVDRECGSDDEVRGEVASLLASHQAAGGFVQDRLRELVTAKCPRNFDGFSWSALDRVLSEPIQPPSAAVEGRQAAKQLAGDLDNIILRALDTEPERRYESAAEFANDVRRYLDHEPVLARRPSVTYRTAKFVRRHRLVVGAAALVVVALAVGLAAATYQARVARASQEQTRMLSNKLVFSCARDRARVGRDGGNDSQSAVAGVGTLPRGHG